MVLVEARNPLNIGAVARAMSNFGFTKLRVVNPYEVAFREARSAMGGAGVLEQATEHNSVADAVSDCTLVVGTTAVRHRQLMHPLHSLSEAAKLMRAELHSENVALLFGSEKFGLSTADLSYCHWVLHIPTHKSNLSMNLGQAAAVCLYELMNACRDLPRKKSSKRVTAAQTERLSETLLDALRISGYVKDRTKRSTEEKVRRLVRRLDLEPEDAEVMLGMLRQIVWKLKT